MPDRYVVLVWSDNAWEAEDWGEDKTVTLSYFQQRRDSGVPVVFVDTQEDR